MIINYTRLILVGKLSVVYFFIWYKSWRWITFANYLDARLYQVYDKNIRELSSMVKVADPTAAIKPQLNFSPTQQKTNFGSSLNFLY
ncbi:MAG TPA: hypothetical protein VLK22_04120 [Candidatus Udaeobacter sp.]|nr:hypothetical protein [Candidatus Udaeobacter sp.]